MSKQESKADYTLILNEVIDEVIDDCKSQINSTDNKKFFVIKVVLVIVIYVFLILNALHDFVSPDYVPECVKDEMHELTLPINRFLHENPFYKNLLIIVASGMIDLNVFMLAGTWICKGKSYKIFFVILIFYLFRGFLQAVFFLRFPSDYIWGHPGIFSITVPYNPANDFFFSGHVGLCTICLVYFTREKMRFMKYFAAVTLIVEFWTLLITRAHYFIDLVIGLIVAHYLCLVADWVHDYILEKKGNKKQGCKQSPLVNTNWKETQNTNKKKKGNRS